MIQKLLKNKYFIILFVIAIILIIIRILSFLSPKQYLPSTTPTNQSPSPSKTNPPLNDPLNSNSNLDTNPSLSPTIEITEVNYQIPLTKLLPYRGKYFEVKRYLKANNLELKVFGKANTELAKQEAQEWLVKNGVDDIDTFTVIY